MTLHDTNEPRKQSREGLADRTILALIRAGTLRCRFAAAFMAVAFGFVSQTAGAAYAQAGETVLYLDAPSVSEERAARAGDVASDYSGPGSPATEETLAWLAFPDRGLEPSEPPEEARDAFASLTAPGDGPGITADAALAAGEVMLAQLEKVEDGSGGEEGGELAAGAVRPVLGDGAKPPEAGPEYEDEAAPPATQPEIADLGTPQDGPPALASAGEVQLEEGGEAPAGEPVGEPDGAGLVVEESGTDPEAPEEGGEAEFASVPSEAALAPSGLGEDAEQREDYGPAGPVSDTGPPPLKRDEEGSMTAPTGETVEESAAGEPVEEQPTAQPTSQSVSEPVSEPADEPAEEPPVEETIAELAESSPEPATAQPPAGADTGPTGGGVAEVAIVPAPAPDGASEGPAPEEPEPTAPAPVAEPVGPPEGAPTSEGQLPTAPPVEYDSGDSGDDEGSEADAEPAMPAEASPERTPAPPEDAPSGSQRFEIVVGGSPTGGAPKHPARREESAQTPEAPSSRDPAPGDGGGSSEGGGSGSVPAESPALLENPPAKSAAEPSVPHEAAAPSERPRPEEATAGDTPVLAEPVGGGGGANQSGAPGVSAPAGEPETAAPPPARAGKANTPRPTDAERRGERLAGRRAETRTVVEWQRAAAQQAAEQQAAIGQQAVPAEHATVIVQQAQQQAVAEQAAIEQQTIEERQAVAAEQAAAEQVAAGQAVVAERHAAEREAIEQQAAAEQAAAEQAAIEQQAIGQAAAEEAAIVAEQEQAAVEQAAVVKQQTAEQAVGRQQPAYTAHQQPQPIEQAPARQPAPAPEVASESSPPVSQPQAAEHVEPAAEAAEVVEPVEQVEQPAQAGRTLQNESPSEPGVATEAIVVDESTTNMEVGR